MELVLVGLNHKSSELSLRERLAALPLEQVRERLKGAGWGEAVVLSTCNRFEVYAVASEGGGAEGLASLVEGMAGEDAETGAYRRSGAEAVEHLFSVAAGLDSLVVGEGEILGQVKASYESARQAQMTGKLTNVLFQRAAFVGKQVRSSTGIAIGHTSVASVAVELAERIFGELSRSEVLLLGAGQMAELCAQHLCAGKVASLKVANRTAEKAEALAGRFKGRAVDWSAIPEALLGCDIVLSSTGSDKPILSRDTVARAMKERRGRSLFVIDIAMPRDVEESVNDLDQVYLYSLQDLDAIVKANMKNRQDEVAKAQAQVKGLAAEFGRWLAEAASGRQAALRHGEAA